jgi:large subunit ribosomal protein L21e
MKKKGGFGRKTRSLFRKKSKDKSKLSLRKYLQSFKLGEIVRLSLESSIQKGMYHPRFYNKKGEIKAKKGRCYEVSITDGKKQKTLIVHPVHLKRG